MGTTMETTGLDVVAFGALPVGHWFRFAGPCGRYWEGRYVQKVGPVTFREPQYEPGEVSAVGSTSQRCLPTAAPPASYVSEALRYRREVDEHVARSGA